MKKLESFKAKKVEVKSIYGGKMQANTFDQNTITLYSGGRPATDDGSDEEWDN